MYIKELELENFKSFKHQKFLLNKGLTCITGPNGSGKSNIFDAILFVLGNNSSNKLRYRHIGDLICKEGKNEFANVKIVFGNNTIVERTITQDGSVFRLNGKRTTQEAITGFLKECKLTSDGHNLVQQGNNKRIVDMTDDGRKELIEEIAGVAKLDEQKQRIEKNQEFVKTKINSAKSVLEERKSLLENLEKEKTVAEDYLQIKGKEVLIKAILLKREKQSLESEVARIQKKTDSLKESVPLKKTELEQIKKNLKIANEKLTELVQKNRNNFDKMSTQNSELAVLNYKLESLQKEEIALNKKKDKNKDYLKELHEKQKLLEQQIGSKEKDKEKLEAVLSELEKNKSKFGSLKTSSAQNEEKQLDVLIKEKTQTLLALKSDFAIIREQQKELQKYQKELESLQKEISVLAYKSVNITVLEDSLSELGSEQNNVKKQLQNLMNEQEKTEVKKRELQSKILVNENEVGFLKKVVSVESRLIVVKDVVDAEKMMEKNISQNKFGTFFFVLEKDKENANSMVFVKVAKPDSKIKTLFEENLQLNKELLDLDKELHQFDVKKKELNAKYEKLLREEKHLAEKIGAAQHENSKLSVRLEFLESRKEESSAKINNLKNRQKEIVNIEAKITALESEIEKVNKKKSLLAGDFSISEYMLVLEDYNKKYNELQTTKFEIKGLEQKLSGLEQEISTTKDEALKCELEIVSANKQLEELAKKQKTLLHTLEAEKSVLVKFESEKSAFENEIKQNENRKAQLSVELSVVDFEDAELKKNDFLKKEELAKKVDEIKKYIELNPNLNLETLAQEYEYNCKTGLKELLNTYFELLTKLNSFGNVNLKAVEDYADYKEKYDAVCERVVQLEMESQDLRNKIKDLLFEKEQKFLYYLDKLNINFKEITTKLGLTEFGLGSVKNEETEEISGVILVCKNKKKSPFSLSGGEKALVTIAFLFSVLKLEPAPFYLLDEIDADLDYRNSEIFYNLLKEFVKDTQILMISHNPVIVNSCEYVIGVTKGTRGVTVVFTNQKQSQDTV